MTNLVIAIDGPAGAGKSTVARALAKELGIRYLDTGAMYRAVAFKAKRAGVGIDDIPGLENLAKGSVIEFGTGEPQPVYLDGEEVTSLIRTLEMGEMASAISTHSEVRRVLVERQKEMVREGGVTLEGRDATTVIAPDATVRIYLTASLEERAKRRQGELTDASYQQVRIEVESRDHRDINRADSPLTVAEGVTVVETGGLTIQEVVAKVKSLIPKSIA